MKTAESPVSVVVCNYNYGRFLKECIESVLSQSHDNFELILVDDGSTDESRDLIRAFKDPRIRTIFQDNGGQAAAFNAGFALARHPFVAFLDSDDTWFPNKLAECIDGFTDDDIVAVQHDLEIMNSDSRPTGRLHSGLPPGVIDLMHEFLGQNHTCFFCPTSSLVCRHAALEKIFPLSPSWRICADVALTRPLVLFGKLRTLKHALGGYRVHGDNSWMDTPGQQRWIENNLKYCDYTNEWLSRAGIQERIDFKRSALYHHHHRLWRNPKNTLIRYFHKLYLAMR